MTAGTQDMIAQLQAQIAQGQQPSLFGLQAAPDQNTLRALLSRLQSQQSVDQAGTTDAGQFSVFANAGQKDFARAGQMLGNILGGPFGNPQPQAVDPNSQSAQQKQAIIAGNQSFNQDLNNQVDPEQAKITALTKLVAAGVPGAADALEKAQTTMLANQAKIADAKKLNAEAESYGTNAANQKLTREQEAQRIALETGKDKWTTISETPQTIIQQNGNGQIEVKQKMPASAAAAAAVSPDAWKAMLDSYHTTGQVPQGLARSPMMASQFWQHEADYQAATGNTAATVLAQKASAKADAVALDQTQKQYAAVSTYVNTFDKNVEQTRKYGNDINFNDVTALNKALSLWDKKVSDPAYAKYNVFFNSVAAEFAKIQSGSLGNAPVTDAAKKEAHEVMDQSIGNGGLNALLDAMRQESQNRLEALESTRQTLIGRLAKGPQVGSPQQTAPQGTAPVAPATPTLNYNPKTGTFE